MSLFDIILALFTQLSLLVTCTFLLGVLKPLLNSLGTRRSDLVQGGLFGLFAILVMLDPIRVADGFLFDLRNVIIAVAGALGGGIPALIVTGFVIVYRLTLGGAGAPLAIGAALTSAALGLGLYFYRKRRASKIDLWLIGLGLAVAVQSLVWLLPLPVETARQVLAAIALPSLLVYPASSWIFGSLLRYQERHFELEAGLSAERTMLRTLIDNVPDYIFIKDKTQRYILSNVAHAHAAGVATPAELIGFPADAFFPAEYVTHHQTDDERVLLGESLIGQERQTVNEDGTLIWVSTTKVPLRDEQGHISGVVGISHDITARKQAEAALQQERNLLRTLIDAFPGNVYIKDAQSRFIDANSETIRKFGARTVGDLVGKTDFDFFPSELATRYFANDQSVIQSGEPLLNLEEPTLDQRTQENLWFLTTKAPIRNERGEITGLVGVGLDITERKRIEKTLQEERTLLRTLIDAMPDYIYIKDRESRFVIGNIATALSLGAATPDDIVGKTDFDFHPSDLAARFFAEEQALLQSGEPLLNHEEVVTDQRTGEQQILLSTNVPLYDSQGRITGLVGANRDITARKQAENALRENEEKLETIFNLLPVGISLINNERQIIEMNPAQERILGMSLDDIMTGKYLARQYLHGDGTPVLAGEFPSSRAMQEQRTILDAEIGFVKEDGATVWTTVSAAPFPGNQGLVMVMADMTERKQAEQERQRLYSALDMVAEGAQLIGFDWRYLYLNETAAQRSRRAKAEMLGHTMMAMYPGIEQTPIFDVLRRCMDQRVSEHMENQFTFPDNRIGSFELHIQPIPEGLFILSTDITERKRAEEQAFTLAAEQQRGTLLREFITDVSHDLRTPLTIIGTSAFLLGKTTDPGKLTQHSDRIVEQISRLGLLLDNFVELAQLEQQASALPFQATGLDRLVQTVVAQSQPEVTANHQRLEYQCETPSAQVLGDPTALSKAIANVVTNAIHYTPQEGVITIRLYCENQNAILEVADTGIGIPASELSNIFDSFYRVDSARSTRSGGAGLGLSIAKKIVALMQGHIEVESEVGKGSVFRIYLPVSQ